MSTTTTGKAIRQLLASLIGGVCEIGAQAGSGATSTSIVDTQNYQGRAIPASMFDNAVLRMTSGSLAGQTTYVDYVDGATGTIYLNPALGGTPADTDEFEIWMRGVDPDYVDRLRDDVLQFTTSVWYPNVITMIPDGDLMTTANGATQGDVSNWVIVGSATRSKVLGASPDAKTRFTLSVVHPTASTDWIDSGNVACNADEIYWLEVPVKAYVTATSAPATASLVPYDVTNGADIAIASSIVSTHTGKGWGKLSFSFQIPSGCSEFKLRLKSNTNNSTTVWGMFACHKVNQSEITLPNRIRTKSRVGKTFLTTQIANASQYNNLFQFKMKEYKNVERTQLGSNVVLYFNAPLSYWNACYYYERVYFNRLQAGYTTATQRSGGDAAVTDCPLEYAAAALAEALCKRMLDRYGADWQDDWVRAASMLNYWEGEFGPEPQHVFQNTVPVNIPQLRV